MWSQREHLFSCWKSQLAFPSGFRFLCCASVPLSQCLRTAPTAWTNSWLDDVFELWSDCQSSISKSTNSERRQTQDVRELLTHVVRMYKEILQLVAVALTVAAFLINDFKRFSPSHTFKREQQRDFYIQHSVKVRSKINVISLVFKQMSQSLRALAAWQLLGLSRPLGFQICLLWFCVFCLYLYLSVRLTSFNKVRSALLMYPNHETVTPAATKLLNLQHISNNSVVILNVTH